MFLRKRFYKVRIRKWWLCEQAAIHAFTCG